MSIDRLATATGWLLVAGFAVFLTGAQLWKPREYQKPLAEALPVIAADRRRLGWIYGWMIAGVVTTTAGMAALWQLLVSAGQALLPSVALATFVLGAALVLVALAFRLTVEPWAAAETATTGVVPAGYPALHAWAIALLAIHMLTGYASMVAMGVALLGTAHVAPAMSWAVIVVASICTLGFAALRGGPFAPPILVHAVTALAGVGLLVR